MAKRPDSHSVRQVRIAPVWRVFVEAKPRQRWPKKLDLRPLAEFAALLVYKGRVVGVATNSPLRDFDAPDAVEFWDLINRQDWDICASMQRGMGSRVFESGYYGPMEDHSLDIRNCVRGKLDC